MSENLAALINEVKNGNVFLEKLTEAHSELKPLLTETKTPKQAKELENTQLHLRNIENYTSQLLEDVRSGREKSLDEIRQEIRLLARTIAASAEDHE